MKFKKDQKTKILLKIIKVLIVNKNQVNNFLILKKVYNK